MQIESTRGVSSTTLRLHEGAGLQQTTGILIALVGLAGLIYHFDRFNTVGMIVSSIFVGVGGWLFMQARSYTVSVDSARRQVRVEVSGSGVQQCDVVAFERITAVEYHDRRRVPRWGKSYLVKCIVLRLDDGSSINACSELSLIGSNKDQAAQRLAKVVGAPCVTLTDTDYV